MNFVVVNIILLIFFGYLQVNIIDIQFIKIQDGIVFFIFFGFWIFLRQLARLYVINKVGHLFEKSETFFLILLQGKYLFKLVEYDEERGSFVALEKFVAMK